MIAFFLITTLILFIINLIINIAVVFAQNSINIQTSISIFVGLILITMNIISLSLI